jgi:hypothetical protein
MIRFSATGAADQQQLQHLNHIGTFSSSSLVLWILLPNRLSSYLHVRQIRKLCEEEHRLGRLLRLLPRDVILEFDKLELRVFAWASSRR